MKIDSILFASANPGKVAEVQEAATGLGQALVGPADLIDYPGGCPQVEENGASYLENAKLKAQAFFAWALMPTLADDSGLEVVTLGGVPGLRTARFAGEGCSAAQNRERLLAVMKDQKDRRAVFRSVLYLIINQRQALLSEALLSGEIAYVERGTGGFGYDALFVVDGFGGKTLAELKEAGIAVKTHRILALESILAKIKAL